MSDVPIPHRREFSRVDVHLQSEVTVDGGVHLNGSMESLSLKGGFFRVANPPAVGSACDIRLHLEGTDIEVRAHGKVVRTTPEGCAFQFVEIVGVDCLEHLRNLIRFNTHTPNQVEQEFHDHLGLQRDQ
jgi:hypothetical protein